MNNKIKELTTGYMNMFTSGYVRWEEIYNKHNELAKIIFDMWKFDLISDNVYKACSETLKDFSVFILMNYKTTNCTK